VTPVRQTIQQGNRVCENFGDNRREIAWAQCMRGVTLVEMMIVVAILAVLLGLAVPNLREFFVANRLSSATGDFVTALATARSEAIRRATNVVIANGQGASSNWSSGWRMCVDADRNSACGNSEETIRRGAVNPTATQTTIYSSYASGVIVFDATGRLTSTAGVFAVCYDRAATNTAYRDGTRSRSRAILVNAAGRIRQAVDSDNDGIPNGDSGNNISGNCWAPLP
jgi:type IV fimbrial biogenesis protein FimT